MATRKALAKTTTRGNSSKGISFKRQYLLLYNAVSLALWISVLGRVLITAFLAGAGFMPSTRPGVLAGLPHIYPSVGSFVRWTQTLALLDIVHAALGLIKSAVWATAIQNFGRLFQVWAVNYVFAYNGLFTPKGTAEGTLGAYDSRTLANQGAYFMMVVVWSIADVTRFMYFILKINDEDGSLKIGVPRFLLWLRYNAFFLLYPIGIWSEWFLIFRSLEYAGELHPLYERVLNSTLMLYLPGAYVMYMHMVTQRNRAGHRELDRLIAAEVEKRDAKKSQ